MKLNICRCLPIAALALTLTACVDDKYDLSDIDTTSRFEVKDLTIPVNLDAVYMTDILKIGEDSKIKIVNVDGQDFYAFSETGSFSSDDIYIKKITAKAPTLKSAQTTLSQSGIAPGTVETLTYNIHKMGEGFHYQAGTVDESIIEADAIGVQDLQFKIKLTTLGVNDIIESQRFNDLVLELPKGMKATSNQGTYDPATGLWTIDNLVTTGNISEAVLTVTYIDLKANNVTIAPNHTLDVVGAFNVRSGLLTLTAKKSNNVPASLPETVSFTVDFSIDDMVADTFTGVIQYKFGGFDIKPISLTNLPTLIQGDGTIIRIANPQIYLQLNNPIANDKLRYSADIELSSVREDWGVTTFIPQGSIDVGYGSGIAGPYNFVMSPSAKSLTVPADFQTDLQHIPFTSLSDILAPPANMPDASGVPSKIDIKVVNPTVPRQSVNNFALGVTIGGVKGKYEMLAPLALSDGSTIVYTDTEDGWNDEDVDAITITKLSATVSVFNSLQFDGELSAYPLDVNGNRIPGVVVTSSKIKGTPDEQVVTIEMTGTITHLDGVTFVARMNSTGDELLAPSESIVLKNIRVKVSGYYEKKL